MDIPSNNVCCAPQQHQKKKNQRGREYAIDLFINWHWANGMSLGFCLNGGGGVCECVFACICALYAVNEYAFASFY